MILGKVEAAKQNFKRFEEPAWGHTELVLKEDQGVDGTMILYQKGRAVDYIFSK